MNKVRHFTCNVSKSPDSLFTDVQHWWSQQRDESWHRPMFHHLGQTLNLNFQSTRNTWKPSKLMSKSIFFWKRSRCLTSYQGPWQLNGIGHITMLLLHRSSILCSHLLSMPRCSRGDVGKRPCSFKLQSRLIVHRQEGHKAGQQTCIYDILQGRVTLLRKQLPEGGVKKFTTIKNILF